MARLFVIVSMALMTLTGIAPASVSVAAQTARMPYIYYYADTLDAVVIERADGTDSRILTPLPVDHQAFSDWSWSPSGEWVAWLNGRSSPYGVRYYADVVRLSSGERSNVLDENVSAAHLEWSPTDDVLLVIDHPTVEQIRLRLIDVAADRTLAAVTYQDAYTPEYYLGGFHPGAWSADGQSVSVPIQENLVSLSRDGAISLRRLWGQWGRDLLDFTHGRALIRTSDYGENVITLRDFTTGDEVELWRSDYAVIPGVYWNDDLTRALISFAWGDEQGWYTSVHLLDWNTRTMMLLPETLSISDDLLFPLGRWRQIWSGDGRFAVVIFTTPGGEARNLQLVDAQSGDIIPVEVENIVDWHWSPFDSTLFVTTVESHSSPTVWHRGECVLKELFGMRRANGT